MSVLEPFFCVVQCETVWPEEAVSHLPGSLFGRRPSSASRPCSLACLRRVVVLRREEWRKEGLEVLCGVPVECGDRDGAVLIVSICVVVM